MQMLAGLWWYPVFFLVVLTILVFVHEFGHYWVARRCGVKVEVFSIGFGREIFGWNDKAGTRWKISLVPLGGYVKMFGDSDAASRPDADAAGRMSESDRKVAFHYKTLRQRSAIVAAGPAANFLFAIAVLWVMFMTAGQSYTPTEIGAVDPGSPAAIAGIEAGDTVLAVNGKPIDRFEQLLRHVQMSDGSPLDIDLKRGEETYSVTVSPKVEKVDTRIGKQQIGDIGAWPKDSPYIAAVAAGSAAAEVGMEAGDLIVEIAGQPIESFSQVMSAVQASPGAMLPMIVERDGQRIAMEPVPASIEADGKQIGRLGITRGSLPLRRLGPVTAFTQSIQTTWIMSVDTLKAVGQVLSGKRDAKELGGPLRIAQMSGESAKIGTDMLIQFMVVLSISLGLINLFPVPLLDGGHLLFYGIEAVRGRPLDERAQQFGFRIGLALVLSLFVFVTFNDLSHLGAFEFVKTLIS